jgi:hypothetical protein
MMPWGRAWLVWGAAQFFYLGTKGGRRHKACDQVYQQGHDFGDPGRSIRRGRAFVFLMQREWHHE